MDSPIETVVQRGVPERFRREAAEIYMGAFRRKLERLAGCSDGVASALAHQLDLDMAVAAFTPERLLGLAGFCHAGRQLGVPNLATCVREVGLVRGILLFINLWLFLRRGGAHELVMDGIAVRAEARGQGVGTRLLDAVTAVAREHRCLWVSLGVADTNPDARRLYERAGFVAVRTVRYPLVHWLFGFSEVTYLRKPVD